MLTGKILGKPEPTRSILHINTDASAIKIRTEDILAVPIVRGLLGHHTVEKPHHFLPIGADTRPADILSMPGKLNPSRCHTTGRVSPWRNLVAHAIARQLYAHN